MSKRMVKIGVLKKGCVPASKNLEEKTLGACSGRLLVVERFSHHCVYSLWYRVLKAWSVPFVSGR